MGPWVRDGWGERERRRKSTVVKVRVQQIAEISKSQGRGVTMSTSKYFPSNYAWDRSAGDSSESLESQVRSTLCADCCWRCDRYRKQSSLLHRFRPLCDFRRHVTHGQGHWQVVLTPDVSRTRTTHQVIRISCAENSHLILLWGLDFILSWQISISLLSSTVRQKHYFPSFCLPWKTPKTVYCLR